MLYEMGTRLKIERTRKHLSQKELAELIGVKEPSISSYESGGVTPPGEVLTKLARIFGVTTDYLYGLEPVRSMSMQGLTDEQITALDHVAEQFKRLNK